MQTDKKRENLTIGVVGLGLIGGSMARAASALGRHVLGFDKDPAVIEQALLRRRFRRIRYPGTICCWSPCIPKPP